MYLPDQLSWDHLMMVTPRIQKAAGYPGEEIARVFNQMCPLGMEIEYWREGTWRFQFPNTALQVMRDLEDQLHPPTS